MSLTLISSIEHVRRRAALAACGVDPDLPMTRAASYANEVWLGDELVLRINWREVGRLAREARIVTRLPADARYPEILALGNDGEIEWMLTRRAPGIALGRAWNGMTTAHRERAIHELADGLAALHATPTDGIPDDIRPPHTLPLATLLALVTETATDPDVAGALTEFIRDRWSAFDAAGYGLVHGDPHLENVLWDGDHVSAVFDLEWSRASWIECDLEILLSVADAPALFAAEDYDTTLDPSAFVDVPRWLRAAQPAWFAHPRLLDRLEVLLVSRTLGVLADGGPEVATAGFRWDHLASVLAGESRFRRDPPAWLSSVQS